MSAPSAASRSAADLAASCARFACRNPHRSLSRDLLRLREPLGRVGDPSHEPYSPQEKLNAAGSLSEDLGERIWDFRLSALDSPHRVSNSVVAFLVQYLIGVCEISEDQRAPGFGYHVSEISRRIEG
jgi:hypothetical protein